MESTESSPCLFNGKGVIIVSYFDDLLFMDEEELKLISIRTKVGNQLLTNDMGLAVDVLEMKLKIHMW